MAGVGFDGVWKEYDSESIAVKDLTIEVESGEFVVLVGPSGCGKTTSLRMLAGLEEITEGTITIDGVVVNNLPPKARGIGMVFQSYAPCLRREVVDHHSVDGDGALCDLF